MKSKIVSVVLAAIVFMTGVRAYAADGNSINKRYIGIYEATPNCYFTISETDCKLHEFLYKGYQGANKDFPYLNAENATS